MSQTMSSQEVSEKRCTMSTKGCAKCGTRKSNDSELKSCSRCLLVKYCSRECQKSDWKRHKRTECQSNDLPKGTGQFLPDLKELAMSRFRNVRVPKPIHKHVLGACWCCGMLISKFAQDKATSKDEISIGRFNMTSVHGRDPYLTKAERGISCPATSILGKPGSTGYMLGVNESGDESFACGFCVKKLTRDNGKHAERHIQKCEDYLYDLDFKAGVEVLSDLSMMEKRLLAQVAIEHDPNLSDGSNSIAGYLKREGKKGVRQMSLTYEYKNIEVLAFPHLMAKAKGFQGGSLKELQHYTLMRLYSADESWRNDPDYVSFSILRLAAYGCNRAKMMVSKWVNTVTATEGFSQRGDLLLLLEHHIDPKMV